MRTPITERVKQVNFLIQHIGTKAAEFSFRIDSTDLNQSPTRANIYQLGCGAWAFAIDGREGFWPYGCSNTYSHAETPEQAYNDLIDYLRGYNGVQAL